MNKQELIGLVNKGAVTHCGLLGSDKAEKMEREAFYARFVGKTGLYKKEETPEVPIEPTDPTPEPAPTIMTLNVPATCAPGSQAEFSAAVVAGDNADKTVLFHGSIENMAALESVEYFQEAIPDTVEAGWYPLPVAEDGTFTFGPAEGFPLHDATTQFRLTTKADATGSVKLAVDLKEGETSLAHAEAEMTIAVAKAKTTRAKATTKATE